MDRPAPAATAAERSPDDAWRRAELRYDRDGGWTGSDLSPWPISVDDLTLELRATSAGNVGLFPEHHRHWPWLREGLVGHEAPAVLNLFASTGATTLALAGAGVAVTHVDGSRPAVAWARHNAELSGLASRPVRWIVDDALAFTRREARRRRRYAAVILDPPSYGHGPDGSRWTLTTALPELLDAVAEVVEDEALILLTAHTAGLLPDDLGHALADAFGRGEIAVEDVELSAASGAVLPAGVAARMILG